MQRHESRTASQGNCPSSDGFNPTISTAPDLPLIDFSKAGGEAPTLLETPSDGIPEADVIVITWASAEWAALEHVFVSGASQPMPYVDQDRHWQDWVEYSSDMPPYSGGSGESWDYWGLYRLVAIQGRKVLLFKSNTHLDWPGETYLEDMIRLLIDRVKPSLVLSIGTAGGASTGDHEGTVGVGNSGAIYEEHKPSHDWPVYGSGWQADWSIVEKLDPLLFPVPTTEEDLQGLADQYNKFFGTSYSLDTLNPLNLNMADTQPKLHNATPDGTPLLTTSTFVVATTSGRYDDYVCVEMDDAVIAKVCKENDTPFGFVRNISDPVQDEELPFCDQKGWGGTIYRSYGFYTSYNGALVAWAIIDAQLGA